MKRIIDIVISELTLAILFPLIVFISLIIIIMSPGPVLYKGLRIGLTGKHFMIYKFRTMVQDAERFGGPSTSDDDPRLTSIGKLIRKFKLDEIPQLFNVLKGEMSLVGPRPEVVSEVDLEDINQKKILGVKPGITDFASLWDVNEGEILKGAADAHEAYQKYIKPTKRVLQLKYIEEMSLLLDFKIMIYTLIRILNKRWVPPEIRGFAPPSVPIKEKTIDR